MHRERYLEKEIRRIQKRLEYLNKMVDHVQEGWQKGYYQNLIRGEEAKLKYITKRIT